MWYGLSPVLFLTWDVWPRNLERTKLIPTHFTCSSICVRFFNLALKRIRTWYWWKKEMVWEDCVYIGFLLWPLFSSVAVPNYDRVVILCVWMYRSCYLSHVLFSWFPMSYERTPFFRSHFASDFWMGGIWGICSVRLASFPFKRSFRRVWSYAVIAPRCASDSTDWAARDWAETWRKVRAFRIKNLQTRRFALSLTCPLCLVGIQTAGN